MTNLFDTLMNAQNGQAVTMMARQFGLSEQQAEQAIEALMPAFSTGLKRKAADPTGMGAILASMMAGGQTGAYEDMSGAFGKQGTEFGNAILGQLFGSKDVSRAVAAQASQASGVGADILKQMLPVIASALMGGMFNQQTSRAQHPQAAASGSMGGVFGQILEQMMQGGMAGGGQPSPRNPNPMDNPLGQILEQMMGGGQRPQSREPAQNPMGDNPWGKMMEEMMRGGQRERAQAPSGNPMGDNPWGQILEQMMGGGQPQPEPSPAPKPRSQPKAKPSSRNPYEDMFGEMFETGRKTQDTYQKGIEDIFDQYLEGMDKRRR